MNTPYVIPQDYEFDEDLRALGRLSDTDQCWRRFQPGLSILQINSILCGAADNNHVGLCHDLRAWVECESHGVTFKRFVRITYDVMRLAVSSVLCSIDI